MDYKYVWQDNILTWDEAVPLGSGQCGCLCWGTPRELRFSLDRTDIWDSTVLWEKPEDFTYQKLVELADAGQERPSGKFSMPPIIILLLRNFLLENCLYILKVETVWFPPFP